MKRAVQSLRRALQQAWLKEAGTATVEFVIAFPVIMMIFFMSFEAGWIMIRQTMLERALDLTVRNLRLGKYTNPTNDSLRTAICSYTSVIANCTSSLMIELTPVNTTTWAMPTLAAPCVDRTQKIQPVTTVQQGSGDEMMMIRVCAVVDLMFPLTGLGLDLPKDASGAFHMIATTAFVNEPT